MRHLGPGVFLAALAAVLAPARASAFECTRAERNDFITIRWERMPIEFAIRAGGPRTMSADDAVSAIQSAYAQWSMPKCTHVGFEYRGVVGADTPLEEMSQVIFVAEDWPHAREAVALTTMTFSTISGAISYGKIEVNEERYTFVDALRDCQGAGDGSSYDLAAVLTHEVGHFIGLAHVNPASEVPTSGPNAATMSATVPTCDTAFRSLETDDHDGLCFIYPYGGEARACGNLPAQNEPYVRNQAFGCTAAPGADPFWLVAALALWLLARPETCSRERSER